MIIIVSEGVGAQKMVLRPDFDFCSDILLKINPLLYGRCFDNLSKQPAGVSNDRVRVGWMPQPER